MTDNKDKVKRYTGDAEETAQTSRNKKTEQMKGLKEERSGRNNMPEEKNYQKPKSEDQNVEKEPQR